MGEMTNTHKSHRLQAEKLNNKNTEIFTKSYFGIMAFNTPDRDINPPDDPKKHYKTCPDCLGEKKIWEEDDDGEEELIDCPTCKGEGDVETDDPEDHEEW